MLSVTKHENSACLKQDYLPSKKKVNVSQVLKTGSALTHTHVPTHTLTHAPTHALTHAPTHALTAPLLQ